MLGAGKTQVKRHNYSPQEAQSSRSLGQKATIKILQWQTLWVWVTGSCRNSYNTHTHIYILINKQSYEQTDFYSKRKSWGWKLWYKPCCKYEETRIYCSLSQSRKPEISKTKYNLIWIEKALTSRAEINTSTAKTKLNIKRIVWVQVTQIP